MVNRNNALRGQMTCSTSALAIALLLAVVVTPTRNAHAQGTPSSGGPSAAPGDTSLTFHGITLYGTVDIGLQYATHSAPISDSYINGTLAFVRPNSNNSVFGATPSNLSQSKIGLQGIEPLVGDWSAVFRLETFFNPQSGEISNALKSLTNNNGRPLADQDSGADSSVAGQTFQASYIGLASPTFGSLTFGRQPTLLHDGVAKYDPQIYSLAFSLLGAQGITAGGGDTEDRRLNSSLRYSEHIGAAHFGAEYKFNGATGSASTAAQFEVGYEYANASIDAYYSEVKDAISMASLSAAQVTALPPLGFSSNNSLAGTVSDNKAYAIMALYTFGAPSVYAGYEYIRFANPATPLSAGFDDIGGYKLAFVNNTAYDNDKNLQVFWAGLRYTATPKLTLAVAYYGYKQNSYATGAHTDCSSDVNGGCSGSETVLTLSADYRFSKRFDTYVGTMYSHVQNGLASGYLHTSNIATTIGMRFLF